MKYFLIASISPLALKEDSHLAADRLVAAGVEFDSTLSAEDNSTTDAKELTKFLIDKMLSCDEVILLENFDYSLLCTGLVNVANLASMKVTRYNQFMYKHGKDAE